MSDYDHMIWIIENFESNGKRSDEDCEAIEIHEKLRLELRDMNAEGLFDLVRYAESHYDAVYVPEAAKSELTVRGIYVDHM